MTSKLTESAIERYAIDLLQSMGYSWKWGPDIAPDGVTPERSSWDAVLLLPRLTEAIKRINPFINDHALEDALKQISRLNNPGLIANNGSFHRMLTGGVKVTWQKDGTQRGDYVWLVDFKNPENNDFLAVNQFTIIENNFIKRPDLWKRSLGVRTG